MKNLEKMTKCRIFQMTPDNVEMLEEKINTALYEEFEEEWELIERQTLCCDKLVVIVCWLQHF